MCKWLTPSEDSKILKFTPRQHTVSVAITYRLPKRTLNYAYAKSSQKVHVPKF